MIKEKILNVGCGNDIYGTDFVDLYSSRPEVKKCDVEKERLPYKKNTFDEVYSAFLFEHLKNPNLVLKEMCRVLKKGGKLVLKTDNAGWWAFHNAKSKAKVHYGGYNRHGEKDVHYALFTLEHLKNHLDNLKLKKIKVNYFEGNEGRTIKIINKILSKTRFKFMAYPHIWAEGIK